MRTSPALAAALAASLVLVSLPAAAADAPQASLVRDIRPSGGSDPRALTRVGDLVFFTANDGSHGRELWVTDGSSGGTRLVRDIRPGSSGSAPMDLTAVGDRLYFTAIDGSHGRELWRSDGTEAGTRLVRDLTPGGTGTHVAGIAALRDRALFVVDGRELWRTDGRPAGTRLVRAFSSASVWDTAAMRGSLYFVANDRIWRTDGTSAGTRRVSPRHLFPSDLTRYRSRVWYSAARYSEFSLGETPRLWVTDGTQAGTRRLPDVLVPLDLTVLGGALFFTAVRPTGSPRLFASDGTITGTGPVTPRVRPLLGMLAAAGRLWMSRMSEPGPWADELWVSDGTAAGTELLKGGTGDWFLADEPLTAVGLEGRIWFAAGPGAVVGDDWTLTDHELWRSDGTPQGTVQAVDIHPTGSSFPRDLVRLGRSIVFSATDGEHGRELWVVHP